MTANGQPFVPDAKVSWPCGHRLSNVITVGNVLNDASNDPTSNLGNPNFEVTLAAPGTQSVRVDGAGRVVNDHGGTSHAAPQVTSTVALLKSLDPSLDAARIKEILTSTARINVDDGSGQLTAVDPGMGAGVLAVDEAVLTVINGVRERNGLGALTPGEMESFGILDAAVAITSDDGIYLVRGYVAACREDCTTLSVHLNNASLVDGTPEQALAQPGTVDWFIEPGPDFPVTVFVQRWDNGAGSRITIEEPQIAGSWAGTLALGDIVIDEPLQLPGRHHSGAGALPPHRSDDGDGTGRRGHRGAVRDRVRGRVAGRLGQRVPGDGGLHGHHGSTGHGRADHR